MKLVQVTLFAGSLLLLAPGCVHRGMVDGFTVNLNQWEKHKSELRGRAAFEFKCPAEQLEWQVIAITGDWPTTVGVSGCGIRGVFIRDPYTGVWIMNSVAGSAEGTGETGTAESGDGGTDPATPAEPVELPPG